jgi:inhibitor of growth protein 4
MIACDNDACSVEWFHYGCVNLKLKPQKAWYCLACQKIRNKKQKTTTIS